MTDDIKIFQKKLTERLLELDLHREPKELYEPIHYTLSLGAKRMRPILAIMGYMCSKGDWEKIIDPALSIELFHNFTLIHDDIMDEAPLRRGEPTVYKKWNKDIAILSGDVLMVMAYDLLMRADYSDFKYLLRLFNQSATEVCEGQQLDMNFEEMASVSESDYLEMIRLKTAVLLGFSLELGGLLGGMPKEDAQHLRDFGINIGIGFQLKDDLLDVYGEAHKFGKQVGGDIIANKKTLLLIKAIELAEGKQKLDLHNLLADKDIDPIHKVREMKAIYADLNIEAIAEKAMNDHFEKGFEQLNALEKSKYNLAPLRDFTEALIARDH
ncbi:MAG: polyprenyl synthetase family protein [Reichenbachiella sp.]|uniref:polyprenyl synthetase family protein n=1 Tax=Reichenbachiella sp. TaxID=2184521 RepID=UPI00329818B9